MNEPAGWGSKKVVYTIEQIQDLDELMRLNGGVVSKVLDIALADNLFDWVDRPSDVPEVVRLIENRESTLKLFKENQRIRVTVIRT
jgi:hypothetical protein